MVNKMTERLEQVSALADDQWDDDALDALLASPELQARWACHHQVKDALQGVNVRLAGADFSRNISAAIAAEPTVLAPKTRPSRGVTLPSTVVKLFRHVGQFAIAATVAAVAIVGVQQMGQDSSNASPLPVLNTQPVFGSSTTPVSLNASAVSGGHAVSQQQAQQRLIEQQRRMSAYFQDHELQQRIQPPADKLTDDLDSQSRK